MLWRHLFEEEVASPSFIRQQLAFQRALYAKMQLCEKEEIVNQHRYSQCAQELEGRMEKYALTLQYLVRNRQEMLEKEVASCRQGTILPCINQKSKAFVDRYFQQDLRFLQALQQELLQ